MSHFNLDDLRQRMAALWSDIKASGYNLEELISSEMQEHFRNLTELKNAKEYIKELEEGEKTLQSKNEGLSKEIKIQKKKIDNLPEDFRQLQVDYKQLERRAEFFKGLMERAEERAVDYQNRWQAAQKSKANSEVTEKRIADLEEESYQQKAIIIKLVEENRTASDLFNDIKETGELALKEKDNKLEAMERFVFQTEERYADLEAESDGFEKAYADLLSRVEDENGNCAAALNAAAQRERVAERLKMATVSEARIMSTFYDRCFQILVTYQHIFQQLLSLEGRNSNRVKWLPEDLQLTLHSAQKECEAFKSLHDAFQYENLELDEVREQLLRMAKNAVRMQESLTDIDEDVSKFLSALRQKPDIWTSVRNKLASPLGR